ERVARSAEAMAAAGATAAPVPDSLLAKVMGNPALAPETANLPAWRRAEIPAAHGQGHATSVARVMAALAGGGAAGDVRVLSEAALARATTEQCFGPDLVLGVPMRWG